MTAARPAVPILVGVDIGTARIKALGLGLDGRELAQVEHPTPWLRNGSDAEMDPGRARERDPGERCRHPGRGGSCRA